tara:strand:+ start:196 stop:891 length:696 start_codon:yes stop_codon:yes gene_type:complete
MTTLLNYNLKKKTGVIIYKNLNIVRKFASDHNSYKLLKNDLKGFSWYNKNFHLDDNNVKNVKLVKSFVDYPLFKGKTVCYWNELSSNYVEAKLVLELYKNYWPSKNYTASHGDLTFSNIIFAKNKKPLIIDWENFSIKENWGYDICYFLISTIALPCLVKNKDKVNYNELSLFRNLWLSFFKEKNLPYLRDPIKFLKRRFKKNFKYRSYKDYYPNKINKYINNQINEAIKR